MDIESLRNELKEQVKIDNIVFKTVSNGVSVETSNISTLKRLIPYLQRKYKENFYQDGFILTIIM